ncbi:MAG: hypothetical protein JWO95_3221 [Verrucomicrobiales bacterium]|nr:hypothetical protein [Verrucomicrobiales bacterium]
MPDADRLTQPNKFSWRSCLLPFLLFFAMVVMIQSFTGAYRAEFGSEPDEAAHYITGLMVRDYIAHGFPRNAMHFAKDYYEHYPKVALGHWPPMFYVIQSAWTLIFSPSRVSIMLLMVVLTSGAATIFFSFLRAKFGVWKGLAGTLLFLYVPLVQQFASAVMTEIPMTLLLLAAAIFWARFLETSRLKYSVLFGLVAAVAILVKFSGFSLALVPIFSLLLTRRFSLLKTRAFWASAIVVTIVAGPWTLATLKIAREGMAGESVGWSFTHAAIPYYAGKLAQMCGFTMLLASLIGLAFTLARRSIMTSADAALGALFISIVVFHMLVPTGFEARHLIPAAPALIYFAWTGADWIATQLRSPRLSLLKSSAIVFTFLAVVFVLTVYYIPRKGYAGYGAVADAIINTSPKNSTLLVASDARGEGMFISEVAMREKRPGHLVQRASKKLAASTWEGGAYHLTYAKKMADKNGAEYSTSDQLATLLKNDSIEYVVLDESIPKQYQTKHLDLLRTALEQHPSDFHLVQNFDLLRANNLHTNALRLYQIAH